ncbi:MAG: hypothetical protein K5753_05050 [Clostridia bacterium]|nr:hypothetical protein [Clostridia bacterium]
MDEKTKKFLSLFPSMAGRVFYCVSEGRDLSKLDIKSATDFSMSTVLSAVEKLRKEGWITLREEKKKSGGKPRSIINVREGAFVCGVSYKSGILTAVKTDLKGEIEASSQLAVMDKSVSPAGYAASALREIVKSGETPVAIGLAINSSDPNALAREIGEGFGAPVFVTSNTGAVAALLLFREKEFPACALGIGVRVKFARCASSIEVTDLSDLTSPCASGGFQTYGDVLSVSAVAERLSDENYRGNYAFNREKFAETRNKKEYSDLLVGCISSLVNEIAVLVRPKTLALFGDYLSDNFFARIKERAVSPEILRRFPIRPEELARGAAFCALKERVFTR